MAPRFVLMLTCALTFSAGGCNKAGETEETSATPRPVGKLSGEGPSAPAEDDRIPAPVGDRIGPQPGHLEGAFAYGSVDLAALVGFGRGLPFDAEVREGFAELRTQFGVELLRPDLLASLGVPAGARLSMSARVVATSEARVREAVEQQRPEFIELVAHARGPSEAEAPKAEATKAEAPAPQPDTIEPSPAPALSSAALELEREAKSLGVHMRVHLPVSDPVQLRNLAARTFTHGGDRWAETCAALGPTLACGGQSDGAYVVREVEGGFQLDLLWTFVGDFEQPDGRFRRAALQEALAVPAATPAAVAELRGQLGLSLHGPQLVEMLRAQSLAEGIAKLGQGWEEGATRALEADAAIAALHTTERVFAGVSIEGELGADHMLLSGRWLVTESGRSLLAGVFEQSEIDADVPTLAALCEGALLCARSRGFPERARFGRLAKGLYADPAAFEQNLQRFDEVALALLLVETWPNALGTLSLLPGNFVGPAESMIFNNAMGIASRILGFGVSVRSLHERRGGIDGDWVAYARLSAADLAALTGMMQLADFRLAATSIAGVDAQIQFAPIPEAELAGNYYALSEPPSGGNAWGWAALADSDDRLRWLAGLPHDDGARPLVYAEIPDLWRLFAGFEEARHDLGFAQTWLVQRGVRAQLDLADDGAPRLRLAMDKQ